jgi:hypothetical protein
MWPAFPASDYYGSSAPSPRHQPTTAFPPVSRLLAGEGTAGMVPTFTLEPFDWRGARAMPLQHRHGYAAGLPRDLLVQRHQPTEEFSAQDVRMRAAAQPRSARFELVVCA